ncbi:hypothetical protein [Pseudomonas nitroreducens]|uniref:hypothetical protein n=1 Tax=Pseudomonas nitroreducens TaxID=46680 RepID=UPI0018768E7E|nr:hypothetical protein [Pseudomonas nitritireducens]
MITKKISRKMPKKFLGVVYDRYIEDFGEGVRHLGSFEVLTTAHEYYRKYMPEIAEVDQKQSLMRPRLLDLILELEARGYLRNSGDGLTYFLTVKGYDEADKSSWQHFVDYWNSNPGLNTLIAVFSMVISIGSVWVAILALSKP